MQAQIRQRKQNKEVEGAALQAGYTPLQAMILSSRMKQVTPEALRRAVTPAKEDLTNAWQLPDIDYAADRIASAVINNEPLILAHDHDVDGCTAGSILREVLIDYFHHPIANVHTYVSHKQKEGYGISDALVNRIFNEGHNAGLCISADQGSCDEPRVARLAKNGIQTVVTDHHHLPDTGPPASAYATVNPCRDDSAFGDSKIAGCHTALLVMQATRDRLVERGHLPKATSDLSELLDLSCVGTVADCVSISESSNNRRIVQYGLHLINTKPRPCFQAIAEVKKLSAPWDAQTLGFVLGPMINSSGNCELAVTPSVMFNCQSCGSLLSSAHAAKEATQASRPVNIAVMRFVFIMSASIPVHQT